MKIKIETETEGTGTDKSLTAKSAAAIQAALDKVNGTATAFTVTYPPVVELLALRAELNLIEKGIVAKDRVGATASFRPAGPEAKSYKASPISTEVTIERKAAGWYLVGVERVKVHPRNPARTRYSASDKAVAAGIKNLLANFGRTTPPTDSPSPA